MWLLSKNESVRSRIIFDENDGATGGRSDESTSSGDINSSDLPSGGRTDYPAFQHFRHTSGT